MNIQELAQQTIVALNIVPAQKVVIDVITPDWDGTPMILITCEPTASEDETQMGPISETTIMKIHALSRERQEAEDLQKQAADAVYDRFEELEQQRGSGIFCIVCREHCTIQPPDNEVYQSYTKFRILHK